MAGWRAAWQASAGNKCAQLALVVKTNWLARGRPVTCGAIARARRAQVRALKTRAQKHLLHPAPLTSSLFALEAPRKVYDWTFLARSLTLWLARSPANSGL